MTKSVLVAMSGGVDSSVAALLLGKKGYDVSGMMLRLWANDAEGTPESEADAKRVCDALGIPFSVCDYQREFKETVIASFISAYENGETPNPCVTCNRHVKFEFMLREADKLGIEKIATGHYAKVEYDGERGRYIVKKAADDKKDQTYMLALLTQEQLSRILFPLGDLTKSEIRELAEENKLASAHKKDSQDICFIPDGDYVKFIEEQTKKTYPIGNFTDTFGNVLGTHKGQIRYTTGQRKGLGIALGAPMYVLRKSTATNEVVLGTNEQLFSDECTVTNLNPIAVSSFTVPFHAEVKIRYSHKATSAWVYPMDNGNVTVKFDEPQRAVTSGQTAAFYDGDILLGGGKII